MSRKSLPVVAVAMLLVIALAAMGLVYGLWSETLTINGTVGTGSVDAAFSNVETWDEETKPVGTCDAVLSADGNTLTVTINNGYPSYLCYVHFWVTNVGSIPIHVHLPTFSAPNELEVELYKCYDEEQQIHSGAAYDCYFTVHVLQSAAQNSSYNFSGSIFAHQWNEEP